MLAIASGKGGCGKTTTALGIATTLAGPETVVQAVDLDCDMPDLHVLAGVDRRPALDAIDPVSPNPEKPKAVLASAPGRPGVGVVPAPETDTPKTVQRCLDRLPPVPTVLDLPAGAGSGAVKPLEIASAVVIVTIREREAIEDALKTATIARELGTEILALVVRSDSPLPETVADRFSIDAESVYRVSHVEGAPLATRELIQTYRRIGAEIGPERLQSA